jgi:hypothetical protein
MIGTLLLDNGWEGVCRISFILACEVMKFNVLSILLYKLENFHFC